MYDAPTATLNDLVEEAEEGEASTPSECDSPSVAARPSSAPRTRVKRQAPPPLSLAVASKSRLQNQRERAMRPLIGSNSIDAKPTIFRGRSLADFVTTATTPTFTLVQQHASRRAQPLLCAVAERPPSRFGATATRERPPLAASLSLPSSLHARRRAHISYTAETKSSAAKRSANAPIGVLPNDDCRLRRALVASSIQNSPVSRSHIFLFPRSNSTTAAASQLVESPTTRRRENAAATATVESNKRKFVGAPIDAAAEYLRLATAHDRASTSTTATASASSCEPTEGEERRRRWRARRSKWSLAEPQAGRYALAVESIATQTSPLASPSAVSLRIAEKTSIFESPMLTDQQPSDSTANQTDSFCSDTETEASHKHATAEDLRSPLSRGELHRLLLLLL